MLPNLVAIKAIPYDQRGHSRDDRPPSDLHARQYDRSEPDPDVALDHHLRPLTTWGIPDGLPDYVKPMIVPSNKRYPRRDQHVVAE
jgi:hypothetical protein